MMTQVLGEHVERLEQAAVYGYASIGRRLEQALLQLTQGEQTALVCCLLEGVWRLSGRRQGRAVPLEEFRRLLQLLRELVRLLYAEHRITVPFKLDVAWLIERLLRVAVASVLLPLLLWVDRLMDALLRRLARQMDWTRCAPLIRLWARLIYWVFGGPRAWFGRVRAFVFSVLIDWRRRVDNLFDWDVTYGADVQAVLDTIDGILLNIDLLLSCPAVVRSRSGGGAEEDDGPRGGGREGGSGGGDDTGGSGGGDGTGGSGGGDGGGGGGTDGGTGGTGGGDGSGGRGGGGSGGGSGSGGRGSGVDPWQASDGWQEYYRGLPQGEWVYLTTDNIARLSARLTGEPVGRLRVVVSRGDCRARLSEETRRLLREAGLL